MCSIHSLPICVKWQQENRLNYNQHQKRKNSKCLNTAPLHSFPIFIHITKTTRMLSNKTIRPLIIAAVAAFMLIATVEAAPASGIKLLSLRHGLSLLTVVRNNINTNIRIKWLLLYRLDSIACQQCGEPPECYPNACPGGKYCQVNTCTCQLQCIKGNDPRK